MTLVNKSLLAIVGPMLALLATSATTFSQQINVSVTNEGNSDFFLTPLWFGLHDGTFDTFNAGDAASSSLEAIAEEGDVSGLQGDFSGVTGQQGVAANAAGFSGAPVIDPGETAMASVAIQNASAYRYFSYASMVIPSNDAFIANDNPMAYEVFDASGTFTGPLTIQVFGNNIWDAGTEVNNTTGAAFSTVGGVGTDQNGVISMLADGGLDNFGGTGIPPGTDIANLIGAGELLATIQVTQTVPEPNGLLMIGLGVLSLAGIRRRR